MATNEIDVRASREAVFAVLADGWSYSNWVVGASHMRAVEADWPAAGSKLFHCSGAWPVVLRDITMIDQCERGHRLTMTASGRPFGQARIELTVRESPDGGCHVTMSEAPVRGLGKIVHNRLTEALLHRRNREALARLAAICERRVVPS